MSNTLKFLILLVIMAFPMFQTVQGMESFSKAEEEQRQKSPGLQLTLTKGSDHTLGGFLGVGEKVLLKLSVDLSGFKISHSKEQVEVPVSLFLTDLNFSPVDYPPVILQVIMNCEPTPLTCSLPSKPPSFDTYGQFTDWLKEGYLTNRTRVTYDFSVDISQVAPSLAQHLGFAGCYHFIGTHTIGNAAVIQPDRWVPHVSYSSQRGNTNKTTATLGGTFYLNSCPYSIDNYQQTFFHPVVEEIVLERNATQKFYSYRWIAQSKVTRKVAYREFPKSQIKNWPDAPFRIYHLMKKDYDDLEQIRHINCWDGDSGQEVGISDGRVFLIVHEDIKKEADNAPYLESIVKDDLGKSYTMHYQYKKGKQPQKKSWQGTEIREIKEETELFQNQFQEEWPIPLHEIIKTMTPQESRRKKEIPCRRYKSKTPPLFPKKEEVLETYSGFGRQTAPLHKQMEETVGAQKIEQPDAIPCRRYKSKTPPLPSKKAEDLKTYAGFGRQTAPLHKQMEETVDAQKIEQRNATPFSPLQKEKEGRPNSKLKVILRRTPKSPPAT